MKPFDYFLVAWWLFGALVAVAQVGKPRKPMSGGVAATVVAITALLIAGLLWSRGVL